jgi:hypothetical protein
MNHLEKRLQRLERVLPRWHVSVEEAKQRSLARLHVYIGGLTGDREHPTVRRAHALLSDDTPGKRAQDFETLQEWNRQHPELLSLRSEIALVDTRIAELLGRVDTGQSGAIWDALQKEWATFRLHRASGDIPKMHASIAHGDALMEQGDGDHLVWGEISEAIEQRRKLVESEQKRLFALQQVLTAEQVLTLAGLLVEIVTTHVADQQMLAQIVADIRALMEQDHPPPRTTMRIVR